MKQMKKYFRVLLLGMFLLTAIPPQVDAQCSMCTAAVTSNAGDEESELASGLNTGIIYLFVLPYLSFVGVAALIYVGYRRRKKREINEDLLKEQTADLPEELDPNRNPEDHG